MLVASSASVIAGQNQGIGGKIYILRQWNYLWVGYADHHGRYFRDRRVSV
jgi:hypothetical protein